MPESVLTASNSETLADLLPNAAAQYGPDEAFLFKNEKGVWEPATYDEILGQVRELSLGLIDLGVEPGDKVSILGNTRPEWTLLSLIHI